MVIDVPEGYDCTQVGGTLVGPGAIFHIKRLADGQPCYATVQEDGSLLIVEADVCKVCGQKSCADWCRLNPGTW